MRRFRHDVRGWPILSCPRWHDMGWLGSCFWLCSPCHVIYVSNKAGWIRQAQGGEQ